MTSSASVLRVGVTGASGRLGTLLMQQLGTQDAPLHVLDQSASVTVVVLVPFTFNVADYAPWAGTVGAAGGSDPFAGAVSAADEAVAVQAAAVESTATTAKLIREPRQLDLADADAVHGAFAGLDIVIHLAATIHADAPWPTVSRNNIDATHNVAEECVRSGVRRLVFASSNHTQAAEFFTSLDPAAVIREPWRSVTPNLP
jgi:nucleoside-diphosphate-sugar epimerase